MITNVIDLGSLYKYSLGYELRNETSNSDSHVGF